MPFFCRQTTFHSTNNQTNMKTQILLLSCLLFSGTLQAQDYLKEVLQRMEGIQTACYLDSLESREPGDTLPLFTATCLTQEYRNPQDTTIGACFVQWKSTDKKQFKTGYDGQVYAVSYPEDKTIVLDDFTARRLPFRPVAPPFFQYTESILRYILETTDSITKEVRETGKTYYIKLAIHEENQIEFFGKAFRMPVPPPEFYVEPISVYEIWIDKPTGLPYKVRREMSHDISVHVCLNPHFNPTGLKDFNLYDYFPRDYEIKRKGEASARRQPSLEGKPAPGWTLRDADGNSFSLDQVRSRVVLLNLTGIGCGACHASIPFLRTLKDRFPPADFELIAIETWGRPLHSIRNYIARNQINYRFLEGSKGIVNDYRTGGAAPYFFLLDEHRIVRKVFYGYSLENSGREIAQAIEELLQL